MRIQFASCQNNYVLDFLKKGYPNSNVTWDKLPKLKESHVAHVRPHGKDSTDTIATPQKTQEMKRCFWLNAKYIQQAIENKNNQG